MNKEVKEVTIPLALWQDVKDTYIAKKGAIEKELAETADKVISLKEALRKIDEILGIAPSSIGTPNEVKRDIPILANSKDMNFIAENGYNQNWGWKDKLAFVYRMKGALPTREYATVLMNLDSELMAKGLIKTTLAISAEFSAYVKRGKWYRVKDSGRNSTYAPKEITKEQLERLKQSPHFIEATHK